MKPMRLLTLLTAGFLLPLAVSGEVVVIDVDSNDVDALVDAVALANLPNAGRTFIEISGQEPTKFASAWPETESALSISGDVTFRPKGVNDRIKFTLSDSLDHMIRFAEVSEEGSLTVIGADISGFGAPGGSGGAILLKGNSKLLSVASLFSDNHAAERGGAIYVDGLGVIEIIDNQFFDNFAGFDGGAIGDEGSVSSVVQNSRFRNNAAPGRGSDLYYFDMPDALGGPAKIKGSSFEFGLISSSRIFLEQRKARLTSNSHLGPGSENQISGTLSELEIFGSALSDVLSQENKLQIRIRNDSGSAPESLCSASEGATIISLGYNVASDDTCTLEQPTDLPSTDPMLSPDEDDIPTPLPGSPLIDHGHSQALVLGDDTLASLPCGHADINGVGRPQDGDGDGGFECDGGAVEVAGSGAVVAGHSGAFFNALRDGEGTYVEILSETLALVYTFSYRPDGSGPAWFLGIGAIKGNSIVITDLVRPIGARFGDAFDKADVEFTQAGAMSMVFPECLAEGAPGNVAYTGKTGLGYEGLITRAQRLGHVLGCGDLTPSPNAGLSGSYFDPARDGEGIIVQWLTSGQVLVVFFTYDMHGDQMWLIGIGTPEGKTVTMDAYYAASFTSWGSAYDPSAVSIEDWGSFTLGWGEACDAVDFSYTSTVDGYGSAQHSYISLSKLFGTTCP